MANKKGYKKTYPPIEITPDMIKFANVNVYPREKKQVPTTAYAWARKKETIGMDYSISYRHFGKLYRVTWKTLVALCELYPNTEYANKEDWERVNREARKAVTDVGRK
jgi:hypothetical protein